MWRKVNTADKPLIIYPGELPTRLYRYRSIRPATLDRLIESEIIGEIIYLAGLKELNDPDEGRFHVKFDGTYSEILEFWRKALRATDSSLTAERVEAIAASNTNDVIKAGYVTPVGVASYTRHVLEHVVRVACFTKLPLNYSMWANYAKYFDPTTGSSDHGGLCIEYQCNESWRCLNLHPVDYGDAIPVLNAVERNELNLVKTVYMKSTEWRCEEEWRIMSTLQAMPPFSNNSTENAKVKVENGVTGILFGLNTPDSVIETIIARVRSVKPTIPFRRVTKNPVTFARELIELSSPGSP